MKKSWKRDAVFFLLSQGLSLFGSSLVQYALVWHITLKTKSGLMMTLITVCGFLPAFFLSPFAGVWADRFDRKKIIMLADGAIAAVTLGLAAAFASGIEAFWLMFLAAALRSAGSAMQQPAVGAFLPQIVPTEALTKVNGVNTSIQSAVMIASPFISGALMSFAPLPAVFLIDVATAAMAIGVLLVFLKVPPHAKAAEGPKVSYLTDLKLGISYIKSHPFLRRYFLYLAFLYFLISPSAFLTPLQVARSFGDDVWRLMSIEVAFSGGMLLGGAFLAMWGGFRNRMRTVVLGCAIMALCAIGLGAIPVFWPYLACMAVFGTALPLLNTPATVLLQERVEEGYMGRVFSVLAMISSSLMPMAMLAFGPLAEIVRVECLLAVSGGMLLLLAGLMSFDRVLLDPGAKRA
jgi:DHA3 family macrolide efflux protein-like MFS transporter